MVLIGYLSLIERKILALVHLRVGPSICFYYGLLTPIADGLKLIFKNLTLVLGFEIFSFIVVCFLTFLCFCVNYFYIPFGLFIFFEMNFTI
jgi:NADH-quinone oxidoreductase subunit H